MPPRVTFLTDLMTPYTVAVLEAMSERCELTALFCSHSGTRAMTWEFSCVPFAHHVVGGLTIRRKHPDSTDFYLSPRILTRIARSRPDAIISSAYSIPSIYAALYATLTRTGLVIQSDGTAGSEAAIDRGQRATRSILARTSQAAAANSRPAAERFVELGWPRERVFHAPHSTNVAPLHAVARARYYGAGTGLSVLHVGRLIRRKGVDRLMAAVAEARRRGADVRLEIVGVGPEEDSLRNMAQLLDVPVTWHGFVDQAGLPAHYAAADAFAFPTLEDPFGIVLLEAAAAGLPVVASPHGGATIELVQDGETGLVVEPEDIDAHAGALVALAQDPGLRERLGRAAHERTLDRTPQRTAAGYLEAVRAVARGPQST